MKLLLLLLACLAVLILLVVVIGALLPRNHVASRSIVLKQPADVVFRTIRDVAAAPTWRTGLRSVELLPDHDGRPAYRETSKNGTMTFVIAAEKPSGQLITRIADDNLPFGGTWTFDLTSDANGTHVRITENGFVTNPVFRFMARFVFGYPSTMNTYLRDLARKFGDVTAVPYP